MRSARRPSSSASVSTCGCRATIKRDIAQPVSDLTAVAGRGAPPIDRNRLLARLAAELATTLGTYARARLRAVRRRMAAPARVPGQAGQAAPARWRQRQGHGRRRRRHRCAGARRRPAPRALPLRRDLAPPRLSVSPRRARRSGPDRRVRCVRSASCRMILVIDVGNSRMKWGLHGPRGWVAQGVVANAEHRHARAPRLAEPAASRARRRRQRRRRSGARARRGPARALAACRSNG